MTDQARRTIPSTIRAMPAMKRPNRQAGIAAQLTCAAMRMPPAIPTPKPATTTTRLPHSVVPLDERLRIVETRIASSPTANTRSTTSKTMRATGWSNGTGITAPTLGRRPDAPRADSPRHDHEQDHQDRDRHDSGDHTRHPAEDDVEDQQDDTGHQNADHGDGSREQAASPLHHGPLVVMMELRAMQAHRGQPEHGTDCRERDEHAVDAVLVRIEGGEPLLKRDGQQK